MSKIWRVTKILLKLVDILLAILTLLTVLVLGVSIIPAIANSDIGQQYPIMVYLYIIVLFYVSIRFIVGMYLKKHEK